MRWVTGILLGAMLALAGCQAVPLPNAYRVTPDGEGLILENQLLVPYVRLISKHVRKTRGWKSTAYDIVYYGKDENGDYDFAVYYKDAPKQPTPAYGGDGYSFNVAIDPETLAMREVPIQ